MGEIRVPEINYVKVAGNLTKDPVFNKTSRNAVVVNFFLAVNRSYKKSNNERMEDVCFIGVVAWNQLAESCIKNLKRGDAVLVEGNLQSRTFDLNDSPNLTIVEIKAKKIQFMNRKSRSSVPRSASVEENDNKTP